MKKIKIHDFEIIYQKMLLNHDQIIGQKKILILVKFLQLFLLHGMKPIKKRIIFTQIMFSGRIDQKVNCLYRAFRPKTAVTKFNQNSQYTSNQQACASMRCLSDISQPSELDSFRNYKNEIEYMTPRDITPP